ncbi:MAG: glycerol-3-phosphate 1-O-acyltransferase PlsY [Oscillospiraceae bacterium]|nr:glycerol-3-phosphate 1-O-acyltransferase PlsY [Oscillospiraceae bacterium]
MEPITVTILALAGALLLGYLMGSVNAAIIVSRLLKGDDIRRHGSGNAGMTNMLRTYGKGPAALTAAVDFLKATVAIILARWLVDVFDLAMLIDVGYLAGLGALTGHLFPLYFHFKGGKGVITALGVLLCVNPLVFAIVAAVFIPLIFITRIVSLCSVIGAASLPFVTWAVRTYQGQPPLWDALFAAAIGAIIIVMHRENIKRLRSGTEHRFGSQKKKEGGDA